MRTRTAIAAVAALAASLFVSPALAGPEWEEGAQDAGSLPGDAQTARGFSPLSHIGGDLNGTLLSLGQPGGADFQDMFLIGIRDPENFTATTLNGLGGFAQFDADLYLFDGNGLALLANLATEEPGRDPLILPMATDGTEQVVPYKGRFLLAIVGRPSAPRSQQGDSPMYNFADPFEVSGPDGNGGAFPIDAWNGFGETGQYLIALTGATLIPYGCNPADMAPPFGVLDFSDVVQFLNYFSQGDLIGADLAAPFGNLNFADIIIFLKAFAGGCNGASD